MLFLFGPLESLSCIGVPERALERVREITGPVTHRQCAAQPNDAD